MSEPRIHESAHFRYERELADVLGPSSAQHEVLTKIEPPSSPDSPGNYRKTARSRRSAMRDRFVSRPRRSRPASRSPPSSPPPPVPLPPPPPPPPADDNSRKARWLNKIQPELLHYGGDWWCLIRFVRSVESACNLMADQFDFTAYRVEMMFSSTPRPDERDAPDEMRLFLEWFGQCGYYIAFSWQLINHYRELLCLIPFSFWELIDNRSLLTNFVSLIQLAHAETAVGRGDKDPGRANVRSTEARRQDLLHTFASYRTAPPRDPQANKLDLSARQRVPLVPTRNLVTTQDHLVANKHLLLKWCAQACGFNTSREVYQPPKRRPLGDEADANPPLDLWRGSEDAPINLSQDSNWTIPTDPDYTNPQRPMKDELGLEMLDPWSSIPSLEVVNPSAPAGPLPEAKQAEPRPPSKKAQKAAEKVAEERKVERAKRALDRAYGSDDPSSSEDADDDAATPPVATGAAFNAKNNQMDVSVQLMYQQGIESLRIKCRKNATSEQVEEHLLLNGSLRDHTFFATYCSILANTNRGHTNRSRPSGVVRNRLSKQWDDLQSFFSRWARTL